MIANNAPLSKSSIPIHVRPPLDSAIPNEASPGDILTGELQLLKDEDKVGLRYLVIVVLTYITITSKKSLVGKFTITCHVGPQPIPSKKSSNGAKAKPTIAERQRDFKIELLMDISDEEMFKQEYEALAAENPKFTPLLLARMRRADKNLDSSKV